MVWRSMIVACGLLWTQLASASPLIPTHEIPDVPKLAQGPELPTGCEATALTMLLQYEGLQINKNTVAKKLPQVAVPHVQGGILRGGDPNLGFVGNPFSREGYGVFHTPIRKLLDEYLPGRGLDLTGSDFDTVLQALADDRPVLAWVTIDLAATRSGSSWQTPSGGNVQWKIPEHCVLLTGYNETSVTFHDPNSGRVVRSNLHTFRSIWEAMGKQAVTVQPLD